MVSLFYVNASNAHRTKPIPVCEWYNVTMKQWWLKTVHAWMKRIDGRWASLSSLVFLGFVLWALPAASSAANTLGLTQSIDTSLGMSADRLWAIAELYGPSLRQAYIIQRWTFDVIWPWVYGSFFWISGVYLVKYLRLSDVWKTLLVIIPLGVGFDFLENSLVSLVFALYPTRWAGLTELAVAMIPIKWFFVGASMVLVMGLGLWAIVHKVIKK